MTHNQANILFGRPSVLQTIIRYTAHKQFTFSKLFSSLFAYKLLEILEDEEKVAIKRDNSLLVPITIMLEQPITVATTLTVYFGGNQHTHGSPKRYLTQRSDLYTG